MYAQKLLKGTLQIIVLSLLAEKEKMYGYDPIFKPEGYQLTFAQMTVEQKNTIRHRGLVVQKLVGGF